MWPEQLEASSTLVPARQLSWGAGSQGAAAWGAWGAGPGVQEPGLLFSEATAWLRTHISPRPGDFCSANKSIHPGAVNDPNRLIQSNLVWVFNIINWRHTLGSQKLSLTFFGFHLTVSSTDGPRLMMVWLSDFSTLQWWQSDTHWVEMVLQILNFDLFLELVICRTILLVTLGSGSEYSSQSATRSRGWTTDTILYPDNHSVFHLPYSVQ